MTAKLTKSRANEIVEMCKAILSKRRTTIREFSKLIGKLVATEPGVEYAPLFIKPLEKIKDRAL